MPKTRTVTLLDVARAAGVSRTTASAALGGSGRISDDTREKVVMVAETLGYTANPAARNLRRGRLGVLGISLPGQVAGMEFYMRFVLGAAERARADHFAVTLLEASDMPAALVSDYVDGLIVVDPLVDDLDVAALMASGKPVVTSERYLGDGPPPVGVVEGDHQAALVELLDHLVAQGATMPALIAPGDNSSWGRTLHSAYLGWCEARGIVPQLSDTAFNATRSKVWQVTRELLTKPPRPDAIVSAPDGAALGVLDAARERGLRVGHDLLVAACVDSTPFEFVQPSITALDQHPRDLGGHCAEALLRHLAGGPARETAERHRIDLVVRESTAGGISVH
ncbi:LacI family DNA-binding transcriptional regulator [Actinomadura madurae]|uniref:LacI family DNA-binding transcriptional regulator n=1 Tax=Actinomadura madurae TaxID=1993 RepID=UPI0027E2946E|nr:LacI family DNA-binding transcriptional regulator [Actinomadura madurae]